MCKYEDAAQPSCGEVQARGVESQVNNIRAPTWPFVLKNSKNDNFYASIDHKVLFQGLQDAIVNVHNKLRAKVAKGEEDRGVNGIGQPKAANMRKLVWSDELATVAQR